MSDAIVIQNRLNLMVWYFADSPEKYTIIPVHVKIICNQSYNKGEVEAIERIDMKTIVSVMENQTIVNYELDELLIEFGTSFDKKEYTRVIHFLETLETSEQVDSVWKKLSQLALDNGNIIMAERCFAEMGDISSAKYLRSTYDTNDLIVAPDVEFYATKAKLAILASNFKEAETIYLQNVIKFG